VAESGSDAGRTGFVVRRARRTQVESLLGAVFMAALAPGFLAFIYFREGESAAVVASFICVPLSLLGLAFLAGVVRMLFDAPMLVISAEGLRWCMRNRSGTFVPWRDIVEFKVVHWPNMNPAIWVALHPWAEKPVGRPWPPGVRRYVGRRVLLPGELVIFPEGLDIEGDTLLEMLRRHLAQRRQDAE
jgi:hypothetical protein